jgi:hypothetical protein
LEKAQEKLLRKSHLEAAMDSVGLKHVTRDTVDELCLRITTSWPRTLSDLISSSATLTNAISREIPSETGAKQPQDADAPGSQEQKASKRGEAASDAPSNDVVLDGELEAEGAKCSADTLAPRHVSASGSKCRTALNPENYYLLAPNVGKKRKTEADGEGSEEVSVSPHEPTVMATEDAGGSGAHLHSGTSENDDVKVIFKSENVATGQETEEQEKATSGTAATGDGTFSSELLADVLCAALPTKVAMKDLVQVMKAKRIQAFKSVQLSSKADGLYSNIQIAERIAECKPDQVTDAGELLDWLIKVRAVVTCA